MKTLAFFGFLAFGVSSLPAQPAAMPPDQKTILFVAGPKDHGRVDRHEYQKDLAVLNGKAPAIRILRNASAIVLESSGDRIPEETHARCCRRMRSPTTRATIRTRSTA